VGGWQRGDLGLPVGVKGLPGVAPLGAVRYLTIADFE
jgi:hypothetical protein